MKKVVPVHAYTRQGVTVGTIVTWYSVFLSVSKDIHSECESDQLRVHESCDGVMTCPECIPPCVPMTAGIGSPHEQEVAS